MMRLCMDQENYPHDFVTALVPAPVPDDEQYNTEFYRTHAGTPGAGDLMCIAANTKYRSLLQVRYVVLKGWYGSSG